MMGTSLTYQLVICGITILSLAPVAALQEGWTCKKPCEQGNYKAQVWLRNKNAAPLCAWRPSANRKVFVIGLPKSGTLTVQVYLRSKGLNVVHHHVAESHLYLGAAICENKAAARPLMHGLLQYDGLTEMNVLRECGRHGKCRQNCWPQIDLLEQIHAEHPDSLFIINVRKAEDFARSVQKWRNLSTKLFHNPPAGLRIGRSKIRNSISTESLVQFYEHHYRKVRQTCTQRGMWCVEVNIDDESGGFNKLADVLGCPHSGNPWTHNSSGPDNKPGLKSSRDNANSTKVLEECSCFHDP